MDNSLIEILIFYNCNVTFDRIYVYNDFYNIYITIKQTTILQMEYRKWDLIKNKLKYLSSFIFQLITQHVIYYITITDTISSHINHIMSFKPAPLDVIHMYS